MFYFFVLVSLNLTRPDTRLIRSRCWWAGAVYEWVGAALTPGRSGDGQKSVFSRFGVSRDVHPDIQTDQGTHPLIESLRQGLILNTKKNQKQSGI